MPLKMPVIRTDDVPRDIKPKVDRAVADFKNYKDGFAESLGIYDERSCGKVPVYVTDSRIAGSTSFVGKKTLTGFETEAELIELSRYLFGSDIERVVDHELTHVLGERLLKYVDVDEPTARLILESMPEYGGFKFNMENGRKDKAQKIISTTPYPRAVRFGFTVEQYYVSGLDGEKGYRAFVRDILKYGSMAKPLERLDRCLKTN